MTSRFEAQPGEEPPGETLPGETLPGDAQLGTAQWSDRRLVGGCLDGNERAWHALVDRYTQLVYAICRRYSTPTDEATDLFQAIWLDAYNDLPKLRKRSSFKAWLTSLANHKAYHWKRKHLERVSHEVTNHDEGRFDRQADDQPSLDDRLANDQLVREAVLALPPRCREMIRLLFFTFPSLPYKEIAKKMGLATGSIGFIRGRCLKRLQETLERRGLP